MELQHQSVKDEFKKKILDEFYEYADFMPKYYKFPGGMPVPISRNDLPYLKGYSVCEKTDGCRYMCLFTKTGDAYLINRRMEIYKIAENSHIKSTLVDGELVQTHACKYEYLIFDVYRSNATCVKYDVIHNRRLMTMKKYLPIVFTLDTYSIKMQLKTFYKFSELSSVLNNKLSHASDGLIFTPLRRKIFHGTDKRTYKWKHPGDHTIDFLLNKSENMLYLWDNKMQKVKICDALISDDVKNVINEYNCNEFIVECKMVETNDNIKHNWMVLKIRDDKDRPNSMRTYLSTIEIVKENVQIEDMNNYM